jgi:hypothetical protein
MQHFRRMDPTLRIAWCVLLCGGMIAAGGLLRAQGADPIARLGPEAWFVVAGVLVTVGVNLEQLRRVRSDVKDLKHEGEEKHTDNSHRLDKLDRRLDGVEQTLTFLRGRRRSDRELDQFGQQNAEGRT